MTAIEEKASIAAAKPGTPRFALNKPPKRPDTSGDGQHDNLDVSNLETRPLDVFEIAGVAALNDGRDLFIRHRDNVIRMLGALRATDTCLQCHTDSKKGDLLGAFSYTFVDTSKVVEKDLKLSPTK
jgi:hypothetical protein